MPWATTLYEHDLHGRRSAKVLPLGQREEFEYTSTGMLERHWPFGVDSSEGATAAILRTYSDAIDRLQELIYPDGKTVTYSYTVDGKREHVDQTGWPRRPRRTTNTYSATDGRLERVDFEEGTHLAYEHHPTTGREHVSTPEQGNQIVQHDELGRMSTVNRSGCPGECFG